MAKKRDWRRYRRPLQYDYKDTWNFVRERLADPSSCQRGQFSTIADGRRPAIAAKGVRIVLCCPRGTFMKTQEGKRMGCYDRRGVRRRSPVAQSVLHEVGKFKFRHSSIWRALMRQPVGADGIRTLVVREPERLPRVAVAGLAAALEGLFGVA